jgi:hypothetical protein
MNIKENIGLIGTYVIFIFMGMLGIFIGIDSVMHLKDPNYMILLGGTGIITLILISIIDKYKNKEKNKRSVNV